MGGRYVSSHIHSPDLAKVLGNTLRLDRDEEIETMVFESDQSTVVVRMQENTEQNQVQTMQP